MTSVMDRATSDGVRPVLLGATVDERAALQTQLSGRTFDGALPSLAAFRFERDSTSGRGRLHLALQECAFWSVILAAHGGGQGVGRSGRERRTTVRRPICCR